MKADLLVSVGPALFGPSWQTPLADALGVSFRSLNRWVSSGSMPDDLPLRLRPVVRARMVELAAVRRLLWSDRST